MAGNKAGRLGASRSHRFGERSNLLRLHAIEIRQGSDRRLYSFAVDAKLLTEFATVSRVRRDARDKLYGYQRAQVLGHIAEIRRYIESDDPLLPNSIVVAFSEEVAFEPTVHGGSHEIRPGVLCVPITEGVADEDKPAWIVDGQQRLAAISDAAVEGFPVSVVGFTARDDRDQRDQFILVNSTKPLPKSLVYELLPKTGALLPDRLRARQVPAQILERLNYDEGSVLQHMIRTATNPEGVIKDNSILRMLENSLSDGILYWFRDPTTNEPRLETMLAILDAFWTSVRDVFPDAWGLPPRRSRLMHGAGIVSMGLLMDAIAESYRREGPTALTSELFADEIRPLAGSCSWTSGFWEFRGERKSWNEIQNVRRDIQFLSDYLLSLYKAQHWQGAYGDSRPA